MVEALEGYELAEIMDNMDDIQEKVYPEKTTSPFGKKSWREMGCTPKMVLAWCQERKIPCTILHGSKACEVYPGEGGRPLVMCFWESHCYAWKGHVAVKLAKRGLYLESRGSTSSARVAKQASKESTPFEEWKPWRGQILRGHFYVQDIEATCRTLLEQGISPKVTMKDRHEIRTLTIGKCTIHAVPDNLQSIQLFRSTWPSVA